MAKNLKGAYNSETNYGVGDIIKADGSYYMMIKDAGAGVVYTDTNYWKRICDPDMIDALEYAVKETERRFSIMQTRGMKEYDGPDLYVIIDELADLMTSQKKQALPPLQRLAQIGRAARVHVIACTQNVMAVTIPTVLKCNFSTVLGLRTATAAQSRYLIAATGCESLPDPKKAGKGIGYLRDGADLDRYELYMYPDEEIARLVNYWTAGAARRAG